MATCVKVEEKMGAVGDRLSARHLKGVGWGPAGAVRGTQGGGGSTAQDVMSAMSSKQRIKGAATHKEAATATKLPSSVSSHYNRPLSDFQGTSPSLLPLHAAGTP
jgi:hypothetical protein